MLKCLLAAIIECNETNDPQYFDFSDNKFSGFSITDKTIYVLYWINHEKLTGFVE
jgi:hypothetical protein